MDLFSSEIRTVGISAGGHLSGDVTVSYVAEAEGDPTVQAYLDIWNSSMRKETESRNRAAALVMMSSRPVLADIRTASGCVPGMKEHMLLHSGPPGQYVNFGETLKKALTAAVLYEGWTRSETEAHRMLENGEIELDSADCHNSSAVRCGVISPSMPVLCVTDRNAGRYVYAPAVRFFGDKGTGRPAAAAASDAARCADILVPALKDTLLENGFIDIFSLAREGLRAGDDCCLRTDYSGSLLKDAVMGSMADNGRQIKPELFRYLGDGTLFLELFTAAVKAMLSSARNDDGCSFITSFCCSGNTAGIRIAGKSDIWFTVDLGKDTGCGDEAVCQLAGAGAPALCCAPSLLERMGLGLFDSLRMMYDSYESTDMYIEGLGIPLSGQPGSPLSIDFIKMCRTSCPLRMAYTDAETPAVADLGMSMITAALKSFVSER